MRVETKANKVLKMKKKRKKRKHLSLFCLFECIESRKGKRILAKQKKTV